ncbi:DnaJ domain protein [Gemmata sp. SH-PL17]|uniref:J domain-containing protein n=1 Tax=Gemmata sp. SH-PL17 TaxID=1630693 RepID=UPI00078EF387|nr:J domain-containing protein [Gemmata sp. SH-PL17]AMV24073.1 DnaJ domain protein [Gemmata sp. SH-PL17]
MSQSIEAYPLQWPAGKPRTIRPERSRFDVSFARARAQVLHEVKLLGGTQPVLSTNIPLRKDGLPYATFKEPRDQGVAVYFTLKGRPMCFACDRWETIRENMQAVAKTIEALRGIERWGSGSMVEQAFTGFVALPSPKSPYDVLGVPKGATVTEIEAAFRQKVKIAHPDAGGAVGAIQELIEARDKLRVAL